MSSYYKLCNSTSGNLNGDLIMKKTTLKALKKKSKAYNSLYLQQDGLIKYF